MGSGALRRLLEIMLQSSAASFLVMRRQARKDQKRKLSAYLPDQNLHLYPSQKRWGFFIISAFQQLCFRLIQYVEGTKVHMFVCSFVLFFISSPEEFRILETNCLPQWQKLEIMKSSRSKEGALHRVKGFYLMSKAVCRCRLRARGEFNDLQPVGICRQTGNKWIVYKCLLQCWLIFH